LINCFVGKCPFPVINGHHHERSINVLSILRTFLKDLRILKTIRRS
jgi:hypothetical protein